MVQSDFPRKFTFGKLEREMCLKSVISALGTEGLQQVQGQHGVQREGFGEGLEDG